MDLLAYHRRQFAYDDWANREALASLQATPTPSARSLKLLAHIIAAEWLWFDRLREQKPRIAVWPTLSLFDCEKHLAELRETWANYFDWVTLESLTHPITYTNTKGEKWKSTLSDVLTHVVIHSAYHRGQIAADVRATGHTPAYTDFIHATRHHYVK